MLLGRQHPLLLIQICQASRTTVLERYLQESPTDDDEWTRKELRQSLWKQLSDKQRGYCEHLLLLAAPHEKNLRVEHDLKDGLMLANSLITHSCATSDCAPSSHGRPVDKTDAEGDLFNSGPTSDLPDDANFNAQSLLLLSQEETDSAMAITSMAT
eukprot:CAMPEP_0172724454 /NCGR_PEP_ID=MMETSP1074-20121228/86029_1 /TAXON_ID=2916 /ORGANISM="Ceratium fusus, Strain PA161109" /LENGTH=155 /DNA_ID=CAMNT_0013550937 /DNA_START=181 /DNA_END=648 /DNA_ORIENTATION=+